MGENKTAAIAQAEKLLMGLKDDKFTGSVKFTFENGEISEDVEKTCTWRFDNGE